MEAGRRSRHPAHHERAPLRQMPWNRLSLRGAPASSRSPRAGSIAASSSRRRRRRPHGRVIPLTTSGLHCGRRVSTAEPVASAVIPLTTSGLHCGAGYRGYDEDSTSSSRSPRAGSIAAPPASAPSRALLASSRSPRAGSIAAGHAVRTGAASGRHPAHHERAPLRPVHRLRRWPVRPPRHPAHHERAPLRPAAASASPTRRRRRHPAHHERAPLRPARCQRADGPAAELVIPLTTSGLHCGPARQRGTVQRLGSSSRSPRAGSIAAPPASAPTRAWRCRHPAHHERAPLRRIGRTPFGYRQEGVIPLTTSGLHCGSRPDHAERLGDVSSRSPRAGSIAAEPSTRRLAQVDGSSRSPRAGSIAAGTPSGHVADSGRRHPAHHERAPLRPEPLAVGVGVFQQVIPLTTSGLHCGDYTVFTSRIQPAVIPLTTSGLHCGLARPRCSRPQI